MTGYKYIATAQNVTVGEQEVTFYPSTPREGAHGIVLLHGSGGTYASWSSVTTWASSELAAHLTRAGFHCVSIQMGGNTYANDVAMSAIDDAMEWFEELGVDASKVHLVGGSMGGGTALRYASLNPDKVASVTGIIPMVSIIRAYNENVLGLRAAIGTAWGVTYPTPLPAGANLSTLATAINTNDIPTQLWYDNADAVIVPQDVIDMGVITGAEVFEITGSDAGHTEPSIKSVVDHGEGRAQTIIQHIIASEEVA